MTKPLALVFYERLMPGSQLVNGLQDLGYRVLAITEAALLMPCALLHLQGLLQPGKATVGVVGVNRTSMPSAKARCTSCVMRLRTRCARA